MAHLISTASGKAEAFYAVTPAWHGLGTVLENAVDSATAMQAAGLDWRVDALQLVARKTINTPEGDIVRDFPVAENFANVRSDTGDILGIVGDTYKIIQNRQAFDFLDSLQQDGVIKYESAGALKGGRIVWILARMPSVDQIAADDDSMRYVLFSTSHDGSGAIHALPTATRVVCWNTLSLAIKGNTGIRHSGDIDQKLNQARRYLSQFDTQFTLFRDKARHLAEKRYTLEQAESYLAELFPASDSKRAESIRQADMDKVRGNMSNPRNSFGTIGGTYWAMYNAVSELIDHGMNWRGESPRDKAENRMMSNLGLHGRAEDFKEQAFELATAMAGV